MANGNRIVSWRSHGSYTDQLAKLWKSVREHERSFEEYEKACRPLGKKHLDRIPQQEIAEVTEKARLRVSAHRVSAANSESVCISLGTAKRREAYHFFFIYYLRERESQKAAGK